MTRRGKDLILDKLKISDEQVFLKGARLPFAGEVQPAPLV